MELRNEIGRVLKVDLPGTLIFDYPTISAMSAMLAAKLGPKDTEPPTEAPSKCETCMIPMCCQTLCCHTSGVPHHPALHGCDLVQAELEHAAEGGRQLSASNCGARRVQQAAMSAHAMHAPGRHQLHTAGPLEYGRHSRVELWRQVKLLIPCIS